MPTVRMYPDDVSLPLRRSQYKAAVARGRETASRANRAYVAGDYREAARLAQQCADIAREIGDAKTEALWTERFKGAEAMAR